MSQPQVADAAVRERALHPSASFIVQAPAGSGKTELLVQRLLVLLGTVAQPEQVLAITFTRKAAGEMRARLLEALAKAAETRAPEVEAALPPHERATLGRAAAVLERDRARGWNLLRSPGRLRILTIDALCGALVRERPLLAGLGEAPRPTERPDAHYEAAARALLADLERQGPVADAMERLLLHLDGNYGRLERLLCAMLMRRDQWLRHVGATEDPAALRAGLEADWREVVAQELATLREELLTRADAAGVDLDAELAALGAHAAGCLSASAPDSLIVALGGAGLPPADPDALPRWAGVAELLTTGSGTWRKSLNRNQGFPTDKDAGDPTELRAAKDRALALIGALGADPDLAARLRAAAALPVPAYSEGQWAVVEALLVLLPQAVRHLRSVFAEQGECDYAEIALAAARTLAPAEETTHGDTGAPAEAPLHSKARHILVDEFQDTSHAQFQLLERLTAGWPGDGSHTLFLVGDPMQSIYRFREAEVGLFLRARSQGIGTLPLEPLRLEVNFRSGEGLVGWVNTVFPAVLAPREDAATGAVPFANARAHHTGEDGPAVHVHPLLLGEAESREQLDAREAAAVVEIVTRVRAERPEERIAVLVRARTLLHAILPALQAAGHVAQAVEIESLAERQEVRDLLLLARALAHPADRVAWLGVLRAPWCGLTLADLLHLAEPPRQTLWARLTDPDVVGGLSADGQARVARVVEALAPALAQRERRDPRRAVEGAWLALGGPACVPPGAWPNVEACLARLEQLGTADGPPSVEALERLLDSLYAVPESSADERLQVMTLHKAKGLQFDTVILPGLGHASGADDAPLLRWFERPLPAPNGTGLLLAPLPPAGPNPDAMFDYLGEVERRKAGHETGRLLYVAVTRPRRALHLLGHAKVTEGALRAPSERTLLSRLWSAVEGEFQAALEAAPRTDPAPDVARDAGVPGVLPAGTLRRLPVDWKPPEPPPSVAWGQPENPPAAPGEPVEFRWAGETARHVGTVVHRLLRLLARDESDAAGAPGEASADAMPALDADAVSAALAALGIGAAERAEAVVKVQEAVRETLADPVGRWILQAHPQARSEFDLTTVVDGRPTRSVIDRTFVADGVRWIIDFKTGTHAGGDTEHFLDEEVKRYHDQLERYAGILRRLEPEVPVRLALYFPLLRAFRDWAPGDEA